MTAARDRFHEHISQCSEAITIYEFLEGHGYTADFGLRFVWVASVSALDHYISELIVEKATEHFSNGVALTPKLSGEGVPLASLQTMRSASAAESVLKFRSIMINTVRFKTFQNAESVSDGLAYIWSEKKNGIKFPTF